MTSQSAPGAECGGITCSNGEEMWQRGIAVSPPKFEVRAALAIEEVGSLIEHSFPDLGSCDRQFLAQRQDIHNDCRFFDLGMEVAR